MIQSSIPRTANMKSAGAKLRSARLRKPVRLKAELERLVAAYGMAAAAAGASLAVLVGSSDAEIVYTPTNTQVLGSVMLDLNHDGLADFVLVSTHRWLGEGATSGSLAVRCAQQTGSGGPCIYRTNRIWGRGGYAYVLPGGFSVRSDKDFFQQRPGSSGSRDARMAWIFYGLYDAGTTTRGQWLTAKNRYLGLQFVIEGQVHYGWARLTVEPSNTGAGQIYSTLTGYAYETVPNKPIITGKTKGPDVVTLPPAKLESGTLGHLARGASLIPAWRRPKTQIKPTDNSR